MRLLLIRHGESVDNVASLYAGSRDSPLTSHGVLQTKRLGAHIAGRRHVLGPVRQIFTSNLQRAYRTAEAIASALEVAEEEEDEARDAAGLDGSLSDGESHGRRSSRPHQRPPPPPPVVQLTELREKDFGSDEGKKYGTRAEKREAGTSLNDAETRESMRARVEQFLTAHLEKTLEQEVLSQDGGEVGEEGVVVIVAHGIILNVLVRALLARYPAQSEPPQPISPPPRSGEFSSAWSNTGVLQARILVRPARLPKAKTEDKAGAAKSTVVAKAASDVKSPRPVLGPFVIEATNNVDHLQGLKKTRGGIGSSKFDSRQKTMDTFFPPTAKKRKHDGTS